MNPKPLLCLALVLSGVLFGCSTTVSNVSSNHQMSPSGLPILYRNPQYNFTFFLPASWEGYAVLTEQWRADQTHLAEPEHGSMIILRNPHWQAGTPCEDIPIHIFTRSQWEAEHKDSFFIGAGGFECEIGHNREYVFGISSRFSADELKGAQEACLIVGQNEEINQPHLYPDP
jgi:hypothetical protein